MHFQYLLVVILYESLYFVISLYQVYLYDLVTKALLWPDNGCYVFQNNQVMRPNVYNGSAL